MHEPLSALLMTRFLSLLSFLSACLSLPVRLGMVLSGSRFCSLWVTLLKYSSYGREAGGGIFLLGGARGCLFLAPTLGWILKKSLHLSFLM